MKKSDKSCFEREIVSTYIQLLVFLAFTLCSLFFVANNAKAECSNAYLKVGAGYKFSENDMVTVDGVDYKIDHSSPISARFELAKDCGKLSFGVAHHSQWATGAPFNDKREWQKTELFVDYKFDLGW